MQNEPMQANPMRASDPLPPKPHAQVYASYAWRRDLAKAARPTPSMLEAARPVGAEEVERGEMAAGRGDARGSSSTSTGGGSGGEGGASSERGSESGSSGKTSSTSRSGGSGSGSIAFQQPDMPLSIAWALCYRMLKRSQIKACVESLKSTFNAADVRDLQVRPAAWADGPAAFEGAGVGLPQLLWA